MFRFIKRNSHVCPVKFKRSPHVDFWLVGFLGVFNWHAVVGLWASGFGPSQNTVCPPCMHAIGAWWCLARQGQLSSGFVAGGPPRCMQPPFGLPAQPHMGLILAGAPHACLFCLHMVALVGACHAISNIRFGPHPWLAKFGGAIGHVWGGVAEKCWPMH